MENIFHPKKIEKLKNLNSYVTKKNKKKNKEIFQNWQAITKYIFATKHKHFERERIGTNKRVMSLHEQNWSETHDKRMVQGETIRLDHAIEDRNDRKIVVGERTTRFYAQ